MKRFLYLIPAGDRAAANAAVKASIDTRGGEHSFRFGVSPAGGLPITHYLASGVVANEKEAAVTAMKTGLAQAKIIEWDMMKEPTKPDELLESNGLQRLKILPSDP